MKIRPRPLLALLLLVLSGTAGAYFPVHQQRKDSLTGQLLVATSDLEDPRFIKTVIYIVEHGPEGAMGVVINRPMGTVAFTEILERMGMKSPQGGGELLIYYGGPVELDRGLVVHTTDVMLETSRAIAGGVAVTSDPALLKSIAEGKAPKKYIFALGYAGWAPQQLEAEIRLGAWLTVEADLSLLFSTDPENTWRRLIQERIFRL